MNWTSTKSLTQPCGECGCNAVAIRAAEACLRQPRRSPSPAGGRRPNEARGRRPFLTITMQERNFSGVDECTLRRHRYLNPASTLPYVIAHSLQHTWALPAFGLGVAGRCAGRQCAWLSFRDISNLVELQVPGRQCRRERLGVSVFARFWRRAFPYWLTREPAGGASLGASLRHLDWWVRSVGGAPAGDPRTGVSLPPLPYTAAVSITEWTCGVRTRGIAARMAK